MVSGMRERFCRVAISAALSSLSVTSASLSISEFTAVAAAAAAAAAHAAPKSSVTSSPAADGLAFCVFPGCVGPSCRPRSARLPATLAADFVLKGNG
eukprot:591911-Pelagomonas_calceolata.AAC.1